VSKSHHCGHGRCGVCGDAGEARRAREDEAAKIDEELELTDEASALVDELVSGPGRIIPKLAAALRRKK
jgi:hypothetical protein